MCCKWGDGWMKFNRQPPGRRCHCDRLLWAVKSLVSVVDLCQREDVAVCVCIWWKGVKWQFPVKSCHMCVTRPQPTVQKWTTWRRWKHNNSNEILFSDVRGQTAESKNRREVFRRGFAPKQLQRSKTLNSAGVISDHFVPEIKPLFSVFWCEIWWLRKATAFDSHLSNG